MDSIGSRVKYLRKELLHINQTEFGTPLGLSQAAIGGYEKEIRNVSEQSVIAICREYGVNEKWLRDGTGEIFNRISNSMITNLAYEYDLDTADCSLIEEYIKLDKQSRNALKNYIRKAFLHFDNVEYEIDREVESYRKELLDEKKVSSVLDTPSEKEA